MPESNRSRYPPDYLGISARDGSLKCNTSSERLRYIGYLNNLSLPISSKTVLICDLNLGKSSFAVCHVFLALMPKYS
ncbi:MAG: hypothetical protein YFSK_1500 [Candidatus Yanofskyibacterium parasiticum]|nr:MAG: hypothetical protein YFSK_1500 [Candidatus Yanofskybacteria bacterium]